MSWVEPVSPSRGKTLARLYSCASGRTSVIASGAKVTFDPSHGLSGSGFDTGSGCHARDNDLSDPVGLQLRLQIRTRKGSPCPLRYHDIAGLAI